MNKFLFDVPPVALTAATWTPLCAIGNEQHATVLGIDLDAILTSITISFNGAAADDPVAVTLEWDDGGGTWTNYSEVTWASDDSSFRTVYVRDTPTVNPASDGVIARWFVNPNGNVVELLQGNEFVIPPRIANDRFLVCVNAPVACDVTLVIGARQ